VAVVKETNGPSRLFIFDLERGTIRFQPTISKREIRSVRLSPDGKLATVPTGDDKEVTLWDVETGVLIDKKVTEGSAADVDWHPSGELLAVVAGKRIEIWKFSGGAMERQQSLRAARA
jgi:WD40 repeat protein